MKQLKFLGLMFLLLLILFLLTKFYLPHFLSYKKIVSSNNFLIEAWISSWEIEQAVKEYGPDPDSRFYIVGFRYPELEAQRSKIDKVDSITENNNGVWLYANSSLNISLADSLSFLSGDSLKIIVKAKGQEAAENFAYFNLVLNGKSIGGAFSQTDYQDFVFDWVVPEEGLNTCYIKFNNDFVFNNTDRNLNIKSVQIGTYSLPANKHNTNIVRDLNNLTSGFGSQAEEVGNYLLSLGIDPKQIATVNFKPVESNQTLAAAEKFNHYNSVSSLPAINVITANIHSRRTWLTYHRIIGKQTQVGVLYYPGPSSEKTKGSKKYPEFYYLMDEFLAYLANWFILTF